MCLAIGRLNQPECGEIFLCSPCSGATLRTVYCVLCLAKSIMLVQLNSCFCLSSAEREVQGGKETIFGRYYAEPLLPFTCCRP